MSLTSVTRGIDRWQYNAFEMSLRCLPSPIFAAWLIFANPAGAQSGKQGHEWKPAFQAISYTQAGTVKSAGRPISGAAIRALRDDLIATTLTDETGSFVLGGMVPGTWDVSATMFGFETAHQNVLVGETPIKIEFTLQLKPAGQFLPQDASRVHGPHDDCTVSVGPCTSRPLDKAADKHDVLLINGATAASQGQQQGYESVDIIGNRAKPKETKIHGSYFYDPRSSILDAAPFSLNGQKNKKPAGSQNLFGFNIGLSMKGPKRIRIDKIMVSASYTGSVQRGGSSLITTVPTLADRGGDFSGTGRVIYDPAAGLPFANNQLPASRISPIAKNLSHYIPLPNQPQVIQNFLSTASIPNVSHALNTHSVMALSHGEQISLAVNWNRGTGRTAQVYGFTDQASGYGVGANVDWRRAFGTHVFNNATLSFHHNTNSVIPYFANGPDVASQLGIGGASRNPMNYGPPNLGFTNFGSLTDGIPSKSAISTAGVSDLFSLNSANHSWSFGAGYSRIHKNTATDANGRGAFTFNGAATGFDFADFLLGLPTSASISYGNSVTYFRNTSYFVFGQDDYHLRPNMTLNLGLRYEFFSPWREKYGRISNVVFGPEFRDATVVTPATSGQPPGLMWPDRNNLAPRTALAWKPSTKSTMVVRLGYAWFYDPGVYNQLKARLAAQPPFGVSSVVNTNAGDALSFTTGLISMPGPTGGAAHTFAVRQHYRNMYAQTWNVSIQWDMPSGLIGELAYLGTKGTHLGVQGIPRLDFKRSGKGTALVYDTPDGNSVYHAGQARLTRRLQGGLSANLSYTYAKSIDDSSALGGPGNAIAQNLDIRRAERGLSSFDRRHSFTAGYIWTLPFSDGSRWSPNGVLMASLLRAWTVTGNIMLATGTPFTAQVIGNQFDPAGAGTTSTSRASATGLPVNTENGYFNLHAFTLPAPGQTGNAGRNTIPGPGLFSMNLSLQRTIRMGERRQLQIRLDSTNITNHVNIASVNTMVNSLTYGRPSAAGGMRTLTCHFGFGF